MTAHTNPNRTSLVKFAGIFCSTLLALGPASRATEQPRIVSLGGSVTETVYALGAGDLLVGADSSSVYPEAAKKLPQVGYQRQIAAEGVLSLHPTIVLATSDAGPAQALDQIKAAGVTIVTVPNEHSIAGVQAKVTAIAKALDREAEGRKLVAGIGKDADEANALIASYKTQPRVLFIYARGGASVNVSGTGTSADAMINLAGAKNAVTEYSNYKPLTSEGAVTAAPDYIVILDGGISGLGGVDKLLEQPGLALTPAGRNKRVVAMDDLYLLGFGPRTGKAVADFARALHTEK
jgi:iron complex transport system substrate-binding protein